MSIEKKSLISNRTATKKANLTKVNAAAQVSTTKVQATAVKSAKVNATAMRGGLKVSPSAVSKISSTMIRYTQVRGK